MDVIIISVVMGDGLMIWREYSDLLFIGFLTILAVIFIETPGLRNNFIRSMLGLLLILFMPGYSLVATLFPRKMDLDGVERAGLSFGLSVAVTSLIVLLLNYTPWGIRTTPILLALSAFTLIMTFTAFMKRWRTGDGGIFSLSTKPLVNHFKGESGGSKVLSVLLIISMVLAVSSTFYVLLKPEQGEKFTEFYILGSGAKAADYPLNMTVNGTGNITMGIVNHEYKKVDYLLVVKSSNLTFQRKVTLENGAKLEIPYSFTGGAPGKKEIEFLLYKLPDETKVYRSLHIWVNVV